MQELMCSLEFLNSAQNELIGGGGGGGGRLSFPSFP